MTDVAKNSLREQAIQELSQLIENIRKGNITSLNIDIRHNYQDPTPIGYNWGEPVYLDSGKKITTTVISFSEVS